MDISEKNETKVMHWITFKASTIYIKSNLFRTVVLDHWATEAVADNLGASSVYQVVGSGFCSSVVEHWSSNPEDAGSILSRKALELHFSQLHGPGLGLIMYILTTREFSEHNFDFHLLTTSVNAKYYY